MFVFRRPIYIYFLVICDGLLTVIVPKFMARMFAEQHYHTHSVSCRTVSFIVLTLLVGRHDGHRTCNNLGVGAWSFAHLIRERARDNTFIQLSSVAWLTG